MPCRERGFWGVKGAQVSPIADLAMGSGLGRDGWIKHRSSAPASLQCVKGSSAPDACRRRIGSAGAKLPAMRPASSVSRLICFNKPYGVLSQFTPEGRWRGLKDFIDVPGVYVAGRLDADSEGLLLLTNDGKEQARISDPRFKMEKTYWVQVEGLPDEAAMAALRRGVMLNDGLTRPAKARAMLEPEGLWARDPPVRFRQSIPTSWIELVIAEGRNRQVRRMTAAVGFPTLRLIRAAIGPYAIEGLAPGAWRG